MKKRKIKLERIAILLFMITGIIYLASSLFLQSHNNDLSIKIQSANDIISVTKGENEVLKISIFSLSSNDRVHDIAKESGLSLNQNNIISISSSSNQ